MLHWQSGWWVWLLIASPAVSLLVVVVASVIYEIGLLTLAHIIYARRGIRCLIIYSQSPLWRDHIASTWLPTIGPVAAMLDWSSRSTWTGGVAVALFRRFCGEQDFNPAVIMFRGWRRPYVFRFFRAFREAKHGRPTYLQSLEEQMFRTLDNSRVRQG
jgi:hypothetical protein